jgi:AraC-like DNA-binding protein
MSREPTLSIRVLWPFVSASQSDPRFVAVLADMGVDPSNLADRDRRVSCRKAMAALARAVDELGDPTLGLRAGDFQDGTFDAIEYAWRHERDLGSALRITQRYGRLVHEGMDTWLEVKGAQTQLCIAARVEQPPAANDFLIATMLNFARRHLVAYWPPAEIHLMHDKPSYVDQYARHFETTVRFGTPYNAIVFDATSLSIPLRAYNPTLARAFERQTQELTQALTGDDSIASQVRDALLQQRPVGSLDMENAASRLEISVATLRRKLTAEGISWSTLLEDVRKEAAVRFLTQPTLTATDVAFLVGFSDVRAFCRAFKRWTGKTPSAFRQSR